MWERRGNVMGSTDESQGNHGGWASTSLPVWVSTDRPDAEMRCKRRESCKRSRVPTVSPVHTFNTSDSQGTTAIASRAGAGLVLIRYLHQSWQGHPADRTCHRDSSWSPSGDTFYGGRRDQPSQGRGQVRPTTEICALCYFQVLQHEVDQAWHRLVSLNSKPRHHISYRQAPRGK